ncbi:MAG: DUF4198 domain-containing protein [Bryobacteraceae bacterium]
MRSFILLFLTSALFAHDLYLRPRAFRLKPGEPAVVEFHNGEAFPKSQAPPVLERLRDAKVQWPGGEAPLSGIRIEGRAAMGGFQAPAAPAFLIAARTVPNYIELPAAKFDDYLAHENLTAIADWRKQAGESGKPGRELYSKYVKAILHTGPASAFVTEPLGQTIEFVPLDDPASLRPGAKLTVQLLYRGAPAANAHVEASSAHGKDVKHRQVGRTDAAGKIDIPLDTAGLWKLHSIHMERRANTAEADWESYWASLTFEVALGDRAEGAFLLATSEDQMDDPANRRAFARARLAFGHPRHIALQFRSYASSDDPLNEAHARQGARRSDPTGFRGLPSFRTLRSARVPRMLVFDLAKPFRMMRGGPAFGDPAARHRL